MRLLFDFKLTNGDVLEGVYFIQYQIPIRGGIGSRIVAYANDSLKCFKGNDEIFNINLLESELVKAYEEETGADVTEQFILLASSMSNLSNPFSLSNRSPLAREVVVLD